MPNKTGGVVRNGARVTSVNTGVSGVIESVGHGNVTVWTGTALKIIDGPMVSEKPRRVRNFRQNDGKASLPKARLYRPKVEKTVTVKAPKVPKVKPVKAPKVKPETLVITERRMTDAERLRAKGLLTVTDRSIFADK